MGRDRFAQQLLSWEWRGVQLEAAIPRCTYFCRAHGREVIAWCELRDISGGRRVEIGSFPECGCGEGGVRAGRSCALPGSGGAVANDDRSC